MERIFRVSGPLYGEFTGEFYSHRPVTRSFAVFFDLRIPALVQEIAWRRPGDKPLFEPIMVK